MTVRRFLLPALALCLAPFAMPSGIAPHNGWHSCTGPFVSSTADAIGGHLSGPDPVSVEYSINLNAGQRIVGLLSSASSTDHARFHFDDATCGAICAAWEYPEETINCRAPVDGKYTLRVFSNEGGDFTLVYAVTPSLFGL